MSRQPTWGRLVFAGLAIAAGLSLIGCSSTIRGTAQPAVENGTINAVSVTNTPKPSPSKPAPSSGKPSPTKSAGNTDFQAEVGDCVTLGGTTTNATIDKASCGSRASNYKVIEKKSKSSQCVSDADNYYAETLNGIEQGALCLDIDWVVGGCMDVGGDEPKRIDCTGANPAKGVKVVKIQQSADDVSVCGSGTGYVYDKRRFVVCVQSL
ncbi:LppU family putative lipoprotein [Nocardia sp. R6R-6]|uniref:LppU family putative lipoprotein n=1 Tax=Nocardia sp. R6R-6 TaxID=3459303 RepID=UPI00403DC843